MEEERKESTAGNPEAMRDYLKMFSMDTAHKPKEMQEPPKDEGKKEAAVVDEQKHDSPTVAKEGKKVGRPRKEKAEMAKNAGSCIVQRSFYIDKELFEKYNMLCVMEGVSLSKSIEDLISDAVKKKYSALLKSLMDKA